MRYGLAAALAIVILAAVACGPDETPTSSPPAPATPAPPPLSLTAYLAFCGEDQEIEDGAAWGEYAAVAEAAIADARTLTPPEALRGFHAASLQTMQMVADFVEYQPAEEIMDPLDLLGVGLIAAGFLTAAVDDQLITRSPDGSAAGSA